MQSRGFYPMVAAQRLGMKYPLRVDEAPRPDSSLDNGPEIARVRELMYWGMDNPARSEWSRLVASKTASQQQMLARYALNHGWWDLSVQATITGKLWNHLTERFPLARQTQFNQYTRDKAFRQATPWRSLVRKARGTRKRDRRSARRG